ncbi:sel1 repeat family protein [Stappia taiwanensis]|uniref:Sel1 repeat family protein n=1 Tax=Stappia taiwanensis TaxID=992267 RepID=A0A838XXK6_9HYPH|nr:tetratricopeptide repeat protein [Stappia taiwanensis]MBA4613278.1 sel1 repeat family protein [Stappia taiwanensis]
MRITSSGIVASLLLGLACSGPVAALDGRPAENGATAVLETVPKGDVSPLEALRAGTRFYYAGEKERALDSLRFAAEKGHPLAAWKLGRMYAKGDGVQEDDIKAFEYFRQIASNYADDSPSSPRAPFIASAFVELGSYYLTGINDSAIRPNVGRAREIFTYAASYFGDADAQYHLGILYLDESDRDPRMAARWLKLAARKGHVTAQARLGELLFNSDFRGTDAQTSGLMWLTIARKRAVGPKADWIAETQERCFGLASEPVRRRATMLAENWIASNHVSVADGR